MMRVGIVSHMDYLKHDTGPGHPERPDRLRAIHGLLDEIGLAQDLDPIVPRSVEQSWLEAVHARAHVENVRSLCEKGAPHMGDGETTICPPSFDIASLAVGGTFEAVDAVMEDRVDSVFCAVRPPGHHAERDRAMGFCLFNNVAITARYIQKTHELERVLIIDWDVHHGNGTQHIFDRDPTVFYFSIHQYPHYPGTGDSNEIGIDEGEGTTLNVPVGAGSGDSEYLDAFRERLLPAAEEFQPEFVIISAGFDAHRDDPLSGTRVTEAGFGEMTQFVLQIVRDFAEGRLISVLEGGYNLDSLSRSLETHLRTLLEA